MSRRRKTVEVEKIRGWVNTLLSHEELHIVRSYGDVTPEQAYRLSAASLLEAVLHETGNYAGFGYRLAPGEQYQEGVTDESRRVYYTKT